MKRKRNSRVADTFQGPCALTQRCFCSQEAAAVFWWRSGAGVGPSEPPIMLRVGGVCVMAHMILTGMSQEEKNKKKYPTQFRFDIKLKSNDLFLHACVQLCHPLSHISSETGPSHRCCHSLALGVKNMGAKGDTL